jgi:hypothetical protein
MPLDTLNLSASADIYELQIVLGVPSIASGYQNVNIPYTGIGSPEDTTVSISSALYSIDNGATWSVMTEVGTSESLTFSPTGTAHSYVWAARTDLGSDLYNNIIKIAFLATGAKGDSLQTSRNVLFSRTTVDQNVITADRSVRLPDDYTGVFGNDLLVNAPKAQ